MLSNKLKKTLLTCLIICSCFFSFGQTEAQKFIKKQLDSEYTSKPELKTPLGKHDFSALFTKTDNCGVYGFIGENYQRLRIKFIYVSKNASSADTYDVYGKSLVKNNLVEFRGTLKISHIRKLLITQHGCEDEARYKGFNGEFVILGDYKLSESKNEKYSGVFQGSFRTDFFLDKNNKVQYDDIEFCSDGYTNNQFVGQWTPYGGNLSKRCNWGDFRIPNSGNFDIGAGEFSPDDQYLKFGWQTVRDLVLNQNNKKARQIEEAKWWE